MYDMCLSTTSVQLKLFEGQGQKGLKGNLVH